MNRAKWVVVTVVLAIVCSVFVAEARLANNDRRAVVLEAFYALDPSYSGSSNLFIGGNAVGDWNYLYTDSSAYSVVKGWYSCNSSVWRISSDICSWSTKSASFYSNLMYYSLYGSYGRGGQCKYFANLILYRSASFQGIIPVYPSSLFNNPNIETNLQKAREGDVITTPSQGVPHTAIVVELKKYSNGTIYGLDVIDSNFVGNPNNTDPEIIGRHLMYISNIQNKYGIWKTMPYYNCRYDPSGANKLCP